MIDAHKLTNDLGHFTGTENYFQYSPIFKNVLLTLGTKFLAEKAKAYWLMDLIATHQNKELRQEDLQVWRLHLRPDGGANVVCTDGNNNAIAAQDIDYTDFPMDIKLFAQYSDKNLIIFLPSEY